MIHKQVVVMMKLKVDLNCYKCYKKVKKALSKFPREFFTLILFSAQFKSLRVETNLESKWIRFLWFVLICRQKK